MARKTDFSDLLNEETSNEVSAEIETATKRKGQSDITPEELQQRKEQRRTQGRKGAKLDQYRICLMVTPENHRYMQDMAGLMGLSVTAFFNKMVETHKQEHLKDYQTLQRLRAKQ